MRRPFPPLCLVCGVDSGPIKWFMIFFIGALVLASIMIFLWAVGSKRLKEDKKMDSLALELEEKN